jgi:hypothetical protein
MPNNARLGDGLLNPRVALPASGSATTYSAGIDTGTTPTGDLVAEVDAIVSAPALTTTQLPDGEAVTYGIQHATDAAFGTAVTLETVGQQVGAGGVGAVAAQFRFRLPGTTERYVRLAPTTSSGCGDCSAASAGLALLF